MFFLFCLLFYFAILENFPYYSRQHANYSPIILINNAHLLVCNENSHTKFLHDYTMMYIIMTLHGLKSVEEY